MDSIDALERIVDMLMGPGGVITLLLLVVGYLIRKVAQYEARIEKLQMLNEERLAKAQGEVSAITMRMLEERQRHPHGAAN